MMGCRKLEFLIWGLSILCLACLCIGFDPKDQYLIDCESPSDTKVGDCVFLSDKSGSKYLSTTQDVLASTNLKLITSFDDSPLYKTARIFTKTSEYSFSITKHGRVWIRLYFFPFVYNSYEMSSVKFVVSTKDHCLLSQFSASVKEFSVNVNFGDLVVTLSPLENSFAFLNAILVISVPDVLITDDARSADTRQNL